MQSCRASRTLGSTAAASPDAQPRPLLRACLSLLVVASADSAHVRSGTADAAAAAAVAAADRRACAGTPLAVDGGLFCGLHHGRSLGSDSGHRRTRGQCSPGTYMKPSRGYNDVPQILNRTTRLPHSHFTQLSSLVRVPSLVRAEWKKSDYTVGIKHLSRGNDELAMWL